MPSGNCNPPSPSASLPAIIVSALAFASRCRRDDQVFQHLDIRRIRTFGSILIRRSSPCHSTSHHHPAPAAPPPRCFPSSPASPACALASAAPASSGRTVFIPRAPSRQRNQYRARPPRPRLASTAGRRHRPSHHAPDHPCAGKGLHDRPHQRMIRGGGSARGRPRRTLLGQPLNPRQRQTSRLVPACARRLGQQRRDLEAKSRGASGCGPARSPAGEAHQMHRVTDAHAASPRAAPPPAPGHRRKPVNRAPLVLAPRP